MIKLSNLQTLTMENYLNFGFKYEKESSQLVKQMLSTKELPVSMEMWEQILYRFKMNAGIIEQYPELKWILSFDFNKRKLKKHKHKKHKLKKRRMRQDSRNRKILTTDQYQYAQ